MSYTNKTANFELPQYIASDKPSYLGDFNEAMRKIDSQMEENRVSAAEAGTGMADAQAKLDKAETDVGNAQTQLNALSAQVTKIENDASGIATNASQAFADANQANATSQTAVTTASNASTQAQAAQQSVATLNADVTGLDARVTALEEGKSSDIQTFTVTASALWQAGTSGNGKGIFYAIKADKKPFDLTLTSLNKTTATGSSVSYEDNAGTHRMTIGTKYTITPKSTDGSWVINVNLALGSGQVASAGVYASATFSIG